jgi:hypothetical protein
MSQIKLTNVRLSYPSLFEAKSFTGNDGKPTKPKFQAVFILDKKQHAELLKRIELETTKTAKEFFNGKLPHLKKKPIRDGAEKEDKDGYGPDVVFISTSSERRPQIVDSDPTIPLVATDNRPYVGCYVNAIISFYAYDHKLGGKGVSCNLLAVQFLRDGDPFGETVDVNEAFSDESSKYEQDPLA